jgi:hypothetical protein
MMQVLYNEKQADGCNGNAVDLYSGDTKFESQPVYRKAWGWPGV